MIAVSAFFALALVVAVAVVFLVQHFPVSRRASAASRCSLLLAALTLAACSGPSSLRVAERGAGAPSPAAAVSRQILLTVEQKSFSALELTGAPSQRYLRRRGYGAAPPAVDRLLDQLAADHDIERRNGWPIESLEVYCEVFEVPDGVELADVIERLLADPRVDLAQPMNVFETLSRYDDPYLDLQPAAAQLGVEQAHLLATGEGVLIAVVDTAVDAGHPDLHGRVRVARDLVTARRKPVVAEVHGTAVAGVIASATNNNEGIVGVAPGVQLAALRACWSLSDGEGGARCTSFSLAQALEVALSIDPAIVNLSLAGPFDPLLTRLLQQVIERGIVVVTAEPASSERAFPASHPGVIVARSSSALQRAAATGVSLVEGEAPPYVGDESSPYRLSAPSDEILTTTPDAGYAFFSGTSFAAAHLSGVIALMMELEPALDARRIADLLTATSVQGPASVSVNACLALEQLTGARVCGRALEVAGVSLDPATAAQTTSR